MSKQDGMLQFNGAMENMSFYKTKKGYAVRKRTGVTGERIASDPKFERTRENGLEFGRACRASKLLRTGFRSMIKHIADSGISTRITKEFSKVIKADATNDRGLRNVMDGEVGFIENFEFNMNSVMDTSLFAPLTATIDRVAGTGSIVVPPFIPTQGVEAPEGATHFIITCGVCSIDFTGEKYESAEAGSGALKLDGNNTSPLTLTATISANSTFPMFLALSIEFVQLVNGKSYQLSNGLYNSMKMMAVSAVV